MISVVETLERRREPMPNMEAIYFITPTVESINLLMDDFKKGSLYKAAHVYVTEGEQLVFLAPSSSSRNANLCLSVQFKFF